jgi:hypothetical protein
MVFAINPSGNDFNTFQSLAKSFNGTSHKMSNSTSNSTSTFNSTNKGASNSTQLNNNGTQLNNNRTNNSTKRAEAAAPVQLRARTVRRSWY